MNSVMKNYNIPHRVENIIVEFIGPTERMEHTKLQNLLKNQEQKKKEFGKHHQEVLLKQKDGQKKIGEKFQEYMFIIDFYPMVIEQE